MTELDVTNKGYLAEVVTQWWFSKICSKLFVKSHKKIPVQEPLFRL